MTIILIIAIIILATIAVVMFIDSIRDDRRRVRATRIARRYPAELTLMRYRGGDAPCVVCGRPTPYTLHGRPIHPEHREDVA